MKLVVYTTARCGDCRRAKRFLKERAMAFREVDVDGDPDAEELVLRVNDGGGRSQRFRWAAATLRAARFIRCSLRKS